MQQQQTHSLVDDAIAMPIQNAQAMREADAPLLAAALAQGREALLALHESLHQLNQHAAVPQQDELNPWLWELGHIGWFEEYWIARNTERDKGTRCKPDAHKNASVLLAADALYDSAHVPHNTRWQLPLPSYRETLAYLQAVRKQTLALLAQTAHTDDALYFYRLVLFHEDMHREAMLYMAQSLGFALNILPSNTDQTKISISANLLILNGVYKNNVLPTSFAFDNELPSQTHTLHAYEIDSHAVSWQRYLPFVESGGYAQRQWWSDAGWSDAAWQWLHEPASEPHTCPRYLRKHGNVWQRCEFGQWRDLNLAAAAVNLTQHEAQAWCRWAGRRLPTEHEWEYACMSQSSSENFVWGEVWEWTASAFTPYPGFEAHPYREYSAPFFDGRHVLKGGSSITAQRMKHPHYRNYFTAERNDVFAGFRSCAI